jgi:hypothetical protein
MRKFQTLIVGMVSVFVLVAAPVALVSADQTNPQVESADQKRVLSASSATAEPTCRRLSATNAGGQDIFTGTGNYKIYSGTAWQDVTCTGTSFRLRYNERAVVISNFNAESDCIGTTPANGQWCQTRALLNGAEGMPLAPETDSFAFDNVKGGNNDWQANSMQRAWEVRCVATAGCQYKFVVQTRMHDSTVSSMWLDEVTAHIRVTTGGAAPM